MGKTVREEEQLFLNIPFVPHTFNLKKRIHGRQTKYLKEIGKKTGAGVMLRGNWPGTLRGKRDPNPIHILIRHSNAEVRESAKVLAESFLQEVKDEINAFIKKNPHESNVPEHLQPLTTASTANGSETAAATQEKVFVNIEEVPRSFDLARHICGRGNKVLKGIRQKTGAQVLLEGVGPDFIAGYGTGSPEPLHVLISHPDPDVRSRAKDSIENRLEKVKNDLKLFVQSCPQ